MKKPKELLRSRSFRAGGYSVLVCALALAIAVSLNFLAGALPQGLTHRDVTQAGLFTLSPQTESLLQGLGEDVTVYWVVQSGQEDAGLEQLLQNYQAGSAHFVMQKRDPDLYPTFLEDYGVSPFYNNSLLVTLGSRYRYVSYYDIYPYDTETQSFAGEQKLTAALQFVTSPSLPKIYFTIGHGEESLPEDFSQALEGANYSSETISLLSSMSVPEDAAALAILGPEKDFDEQELEAVEEYLMNGGSLLYLSDPMDRRPQKLEALPREIEFRKELPKTLVGKVAYRVLEEEANAKAGPRRSACQTRHGGGFRTPARSAPPDRPPAVRKGIRSAGHRPEYHGCGRSPPWQAFCSRSRSALWPPGGRPSHRHTAP